jgi:S1-C subfamily serine protease
MQPVQIPESLQNKAGVTASSGLLVMQVESGGAADAAGILLGDILVDMDGRSFVDLDDVYSALGDKRPGQVVQTSLIRGGNQMELSVKIGERPSR